MLSRLRDKIKEENGYAVVMTALSFSLLLAFMGLSIDVGLLFSARRHIRLTADAAATAGALDYLNTSSSSSAITAGQNAATANGITDGVGGAHVYITNPVTSGAHTGSAVVQAVVSQPQSTFFMRMVGINSMNVSAKAVAGNAPGPCIYLMNSSGDDLTISGNSTIEGIDPSTGAVTTGCGIYSNANVNVGGNSNYVKMAYTAARGSLTGNSNTNPAPVITGAPSETPPKKLLVSPPTQPTSCGLPTGATSRTQGGVTTYTAAITSMSAGTCYGIPTVGSTTQILNLTISSATLAAGNYGFNLGTASTGPHSSGGTLTIGSNVTGPCALATCQGYTSPPQNAAGITLDIYTGNFSVASTSSNIYLYAPSNNTTYDGIVLLEPSTNTGTINVQWGSATGAFVGMIDASGANLTLQDGGGATLVTGFVVGSLTLGPSTIKVENYSAAFSNSPMNTVALVE